jgi:iron complex outermembrane recepter protein
MSNRRFVRAFVRTSILISPFLALSSALAMAQGLPRALPSQSLEDALDSFAAMTGLQVVYRAEIAKGLHTDGAAAGLSAQQALGALLRETGLTYTFVNDHTVAITKATQQVHATQPEASSSAEEEVQGAASSSEPAPHAGKNDVPSVPLEEVVVTGSHIRNTVVASPVVVISRQQMREAGQTDLGQVVRSIPQNFTGGQNPGIGFGGSDNRNTNSNITGGSSLNLRGLGPDATLTLLNGHRLSYGSFTQSVDISTIPLAAVDRLEVVADGASALYGSDAVGGVANVILQRDYDGVNVTARVGGATAGGDDQRQYSVVAGTRWDTGGVIATFNSEHDTPIRSYQRDRTAYLTEPYLLLPGQEAYSFLLSGHQNLSDHVEVALDTLYSNRKSETRYSSPPTIGGTRRDDSSYTVAPSITFQLPTDWRASLSGTLARDRAIIGNTTFGMDLSVQADSKYCWCNSSQSIEADAEGPFLQLPAGSARLALGAGYRRNEFDNRYEYSTSTYHNASGDRDSRFAFGEVSLPLISSAQAVPFVERILLSGAVRYEDYSDFGSVTTPKIGLVYSPSEDADLKISWGRSFKTPNLWQQYQSTATYLYKSTTLGGTSAAQTALLVYGGNRDLQPERANTRSATLVLHPRAIPGLRIEPSYFNIEYRDRIALPVATITASLSNPVYQEFVTRNPSAEQQQQFIAAATLGLQNLSGLAYAPGNVVAAVDDLYTNVAVQRLHGVDLPITYDLEVGPGALTVTSQMSWLHGSQRNTSESDPFAIAGVIYNPPHFKNRTGASWKQGALTFASFYNYLGGLTDVRTTPNPQGHAMQTIDLSVLYASPSNQPLLRGVEMDFSVQNLTNEAPPYLRNALAYHLNFDSSNYSIVGRFVSFSISKRW